MSIPKIDPYPPAPTPEDDEATFDEKAYEHAASLETRRVQMNEVATYVNTRASDANNRAAAAAASATASANSATRSDEWANKAPGSVVASGKYSARHYSDLSDKFANAPEDEEVEPGKYSALHWQEKAKKIADVHATTVATDPLPTILATNVQEALQDLAYQADQLRIAKNQLKYGDGPYPVLDFQFAGAKYLDPRIQFSRASFDWDWHGKEHGVNEPILLESGLQMIGPRTNLLNQSSNLMSTVWTRRDRITPNIALAPNGTMTAAKFTESSAANAWQSINRTDGTPLVGETYTISAYFKKAERSLAYLRVMGSQYYYDLETGGDYHRIGSNLTLVDKGAIPVGGGWFLVYYTVELTGERASYDMGLGTAQEMRFDGFIYEGDGVSGLYVWQPNLKTGMLTPPVFTENSQVTVAKSSLVVPSRGELSNSTGSLILCVDALFRDNVHAYCRFNFVAGGYVGIRYVRTSHYIDVYGFLDGTGTIVDSANIPFQQVRKIGFTYSGRDLKVCVNGDAVESLQLRADIPEISTLSCNLSMLSQSLTYYDKALTDIQLQEFTTL